MKRLFKNISVVLIITVFLTNIGVKICADSYETGENIEIAVHGLTANNVQNVVTSFFSQREKFLQGEVNTFQLQLSQ